MGIAAASMGNLSYTIIDNGWDTM